MMTCAADITDKDTLSRAALANLCKHSTQACMVAGRPLCAVQSEELACNIMITCAADITDKDSLSRAAFANLFSYFTQA